jgi:Cu+-exporting ATPase
VTDVSVNLATARATVEHRPQWGGVEALRRVIADEGYEFLGIPDEGGEDPITAARERERKDLTRRFAVGIVLSSLIFLGSMQHWFPFLMGIPRQPLLIALFVLTAPVVFWVGSRFFMGALKAAARRHGHEHPGGVGALAAYLYSTLATFSPGLFAEAG